MQKIAESAAKQSCRGIVPTVSEFMTVNEVIEKSKEGFDVATENNLFIILDTNLTEELINEGFARECISRVQQMRKSKDLQMMDNIVINITGSEKFMNAVNIHLEYIKEETLALEIINQESEDMTEDVLNGENVKIGITKA